MIILWIGAGATLFALSVYQWLAKTTQDMPRVDPR